jgi:hypothetical protein
MGPYPEIVEIEGELTEVGIFADKSGYGIILDTEDGRVMLSNMRDDDVGRLLSGVGGRVRIIIEPIDDIESEEL